MGSISIEDFQESVSRAPLIPGHHSKTLDLGSGGRTVSCGPSGDILQLSSFHPRHGMVVACPFGQFDGTRFHDSEYVRKYRKKLLNYVHSGTRGFGLGFNGDLLNLQIEFVDNNWIQITYSIAEVQFATSIFVTKSGDIVQSTVLTSATPGIHSVDYTLDFTLSVNRASYGQLTEGGPIPIPESRNDFKLLESGRYWGIVNENLDAMVEGSLYINEEAVHLGSSLFDESFIRTPAYKVYHGNIQLHQGQTVTLTATFNLHPDTTPITTTSYPSRPPVSLKGGWNLANDEKGTIIRRNLEYILGNCTFPVGDGAVCFITDHVALPLGWNRDNYWQIRFLLDVYNNLHTIAHPMTAQVYSTQIRDCVKGHLKWAFYLAQRPHGYWHRSYLANGVPKDGPVFQLDQQCYPILELCDFKSQFPDERKLVEGILRAPCLSQICQMFENHRDQSTGLYSTDETPGDDAVELPFHFSSHVLLWYTYSQLATLIQSFPDSSHLKSFNLQKIADDIKSATLHHFITSHPVSGKTVFAYLTDGAGNHTFYHDANDLPTLYAFDWGFLSSPDLRKAWENTMEFALSPLNNGGYYPSGPFGGLGSIHTAAPWPLGFAQEFIYANLTSNKKNVIDAWRRIKGSMFWDGLFAEAVNGENGECISKSWFSWPGSVIGSAVLRFDIKEKEVLGTL